MRRQAHRHRHTHAHIAYLLVRICLEMLIQWMVRGTFKFDIFLFYSNRCQVRQAQSTHTHAIFLPNVSIESSSLLLCVLVLFSINIQHTRQTQWIHTRIYIVIILDELKINVCALHTFYWNRKKNRRENEWEEKNRLKWMGRWREGDEI